MSTPEERLEEERMDAWQEAAAAADKLYRVARICNKSEDEGMIRLSSRAHFLWTQADALKRKLAK